MMQTAVPEASELPRGGYRSVFGEYSFYPTLDYKREDSSFSSMTPSPLPQTTSKKVRVVDMELPLDTVKTRHDMVWKKPSSTALLQPPLSRRASSSATISGAVIANKGTQYRRGAAEPSATHASEPSSLSSSSPPRRVPLLHRYRAASSPSVGISRSAVSCNGKNNSHSEGSSGSRRTALSREEPRDVEARSVSPQPFFSSASSSRRERETQVTTPVMAQRRRHSSPEEGRSVFTTPGTQQRRFNGPAIVSTTTAPLRAMSQRPLQPTNSSKLVPSQSSRRMPAGGSQGPLERSAGEERGEESAKRSSVNFTTSSHRNRRATKDAEERRCSQTQAAHPEDGVMVCEDAHCIHSRESIVEFIAMQREVRQCYVTIRAQEEIILRLQDEVECFRSDHSLRGGTEEGEEEGEVKEDDEEERMQSELQQEKMTEAIVAIQSEYAARDHDKEMRLQQRITALEKEYEERLARAQQELQRAHKAKWRRAFQEATSPEPHGTAVASLDSPFREARNIIANSGHHYYESGDAATPSPAHHIPVPTSRVLNSSARYTENNINNNSSSSRYKYAADSDNVEKEASLAIASEVQREKEQLSIECAELRRAVDALTEALERSEQRCQRAHDALRTAKMGETELESQVAPLFSEKVNPALLEDEARQLHTRESPKATTRERPPFQHSSTVGDTAGSARLSMGSPLLSQERSISLRARSLFLPPRLPLATTTTGQDSSSPPSSMARASTPPRWRRCLSPQEEQPHSSSSMRTPNRLAPSPPSEADTTPAPPHSFLYGGAEATESWSEGNHASDVHSIHKGSMKVSGAATVHDFPVGAAVRSTPPIAEDAASDEAIESVDEVVEDLYDEATDLHTTMDAAARTEVEDANALEGPCRELVRALLDKERQVAEMAVERTRYRELYESLLLSRAKESPP